MQDPRRKILNSDRQMLVSVMAILLVLVVAGLVWIAFVVQTVREDHLLVIRQGDSPEQVHQQLLDAALFRFPLISGSIVRVRGGLGDVAAGGYMLPAGVNLWQACGILAGPPDLLWLIVPEGLRKEEIAGLAAMVFGWDSAQEDQFLSPSFVTPFGLNDGWYFPDSYLVPRGDSPDQVARRMRDRFNERFGILYPQFLHENIANDKALVFASIIQREAASPDDMPLIAGILWNRLRAGMRLECDATLQYAKKRELNSRWWLPVAPEDKAEDSLFNTYRHKGLPPSPICNPGVAALQAVLHPMTTECFFYLHAGGKTHCSVDYDEHRANIERYLRQ